MNRTRSKQIRHSVVNHGTPKHLVNSVARKLRKEYTRSPEPIRKHMREQMQ